MIALPVVARQVAGSTRSPDGAPSLHDRPAQLTAVRAMGARLRTGGGLVPRWLTRPDALQRVATVRSAPPLEGRAYEIPRPEAVQVF